MKWTQPKLEPPENVGGNNARLKARRKVFIVAVVILLLALIGGIGWSRLGSRQQPAANLEAAQPCKDTSQSGVLHEASAFLDARKSAHSSLHWFSCQYSEHTKQQYSYAGDNGH